MADKFPGPYMNSVPKEGSDPVMVYPPFDKTEIGARTSGLPKSISNGNSIDHVGSAVGGPIDRR